MKVAAVRAEEQSEADAFMRGEWSCGECGSSDEEYTVEEIASRTAEATAVLGRRSRVAEVQWSGRKVPKLRDKYGDG